MAENFEFNIDKQNRTITIRKVVQAPVDKVWNAFTQNNQLEQWWAPKPWRAKTGEMDFREGGHWLYAMQGPNGEEHWGRMDYQSIKPRQNFAFEDVFCDSEGNANRELPVSHSQVNFRDNGNSTVIEWTSRYDRQEDIDQLEQMGFREGVNMALNNLDDLLRR